MIEKYDSLTPKFGEKNTHVKYLQRYLRETIDNSLVVDSSFGPKTEDTLKKLQSISNLKVTGKYEGDTKEYLDVVIGKRYIQEWRYKQVAALVGRDEKQFTALAKSIANTESLSEGFNPDGSVKLLFERHKFYNYIRPRLAANPLELEHIEAHYQLTLKNADEAVDLIHKRNPEICNPKSGGYRVGYAEIERFKTAFSINPNAASDSASFGLYQIMGFNAKHCGYATGYEMMLDFMDCEYKHLLAFAKFLEANSAIYTYLKNNKYDSIAKLYNGPRYADNNYHVKIKKALNSFGY